MFSYFYVIGLLLGLGFYALTYLFVRNLENKKRVLVVAILGAAVLIASFTLIGGFSGMPFGILSLGVLTVAGLLAIFGKRLLWKKIIFAAIILCTASYIAFGYFNKVDYWVVKKREYAYTGDYGEYVRNIKSDTSIKGYKTFTISEGDKGVVLSLGDKMKGNHIEVLDVEEQPGTTIIKIRTIYNKSEEENPFITIGFNRLQPEVVIEDTDGTLYEEVK